MKPITVYLAGPYRRPDPCANTFDAVKLADSLLPSGFIPLVPHLTHLWHTMAPKPDRFWLDYDLLWLAKCDALLRFGGESVGADAEVVEANRLGIPVFFSVEQLKWRFGRT